MTFSCFSSKSIRALLTNDITQITLILGGGVPWIKDRHPPTWKMASLTAGLKTGAYFAHYSFRVSMSAWPQAFTICGRTKKVQVWLSKLGHQNPCDVKSSEAMTTGKAACLLTLPRIPPTTQRATFSLANFVSNCSVTETTLSGTLQEAAAL